MVSNINIRAAKALGFKYNEELGGYESEEMYALVHGNMTRVVHVDDMKFDTSYDWAMLGVVEIVKRGVNSFHIWPNYNKNGCLEITWGRGSQGIGRMKGPFSDGPKLITQAWLKVMKEYDE